MNSDYLQGSLNSFSRQNAPRVAHPRVPAYRVGESLVPGRRRWPAGAQYGFGADGHQLTLFVPSVDPRIIEDVRRGEAEFAMVGESPVFLLAYRLGGRSSWSAVPFGWHLQHAECRVVPSLDPSPEARALLWISLVGADDGVIHAQRGVALGPAFTRSLHDAIQAQATTSFNSLDCMLALSELPKEEPSLSRWIEEVGIRTMANT
jgi:hypothetical protein